MGATTATYTLRNGLIRYFIKAKKSVLDELLGIMDREVWEGINYAQLTKTQRNQLLNVKFIITPKETAVVIFDKIKARLVRESSNLGSDYH